MTFFEQQHHARQRSFLLILYFSLAVLCIVLAVNFAAFWLWTVFDKDSAFFDPHASQTFLFLNWLFSPPGAMTTLAVSLFVAIGTIYKILQLRGEGPDYVAQLLGGTEVGSHPTDALEKRLRNVVEEMAIASGCPIPRIFVLKHESAINAFAAGTDPANSVVAVTQGALESLNRDQLQGVIAHEFSHIFNGDVRLNMHLLGVLHGILLMALTGRVILQTFGRMNSGRRRGGRGQSGAGLFYFVALALFLMIIGYVGLIFGRLIKSAVSRQREFLADASAVQFTRNPTGLAGALSAIKNSSQTGRLDHAQSEQFSHFFFSDALARWTSLFATHPPLDERIRRILNQPLSNESLRSSENRIRPSDAFAQVSDQQLAFAAQVVRRAESSRSELSEPSDIVALVLAIALRPNPHDIDIMNSVAKHFGMYAAQSLSRIAKSLTPLSPDEVLSALDLALVSAKELAETDKIKLLEFIKTTIQESELGIHEACLLALATMELNPPPIRLGKRVRYPQLLNPISTVLSVMARMGHVDEDSARRAYQAGMYRMFYGQHTLSPEGAPDGRRLFAALLELRQITHPDQRKRLVEACFEAAMYDNSINAVEENILRATCAMVQLPMPPQMTK